MEAAETVKWSGKELGSYSSAMEDLDQLKPDLMEVEGQRAFGEQKG